MQTQTNDGLWLPKNKKRRQFRVTFRPGHGADVQEWSGLAHSRDHATALATGATGCIHPPLQIVEIVEVVRPSGRPGGGEYTTWQA